MWSRQDKVWLHYTHNVMAADAIDASFLVGYLHQTGVHRVYLSALEVIDLQRYKLVKNPGKIHNVFQSRMHLPFIFVAGKN